MKAPFACVGKAGLGFASSKREFGLREMTFFGSAFPSQRVSAYKQRVSNLGSVPKMPELANQSVYFLVTLSFFTLSYPNQVKKFRLLQNIFGQKSVLAEDGTQLIDELCKDPNNLSDFRCACRKPKPGTSVWLTPGFTLPTLLRSKITLLTNRVNHSRRMCFCFLLRSFQTHWS